MPDRRARLLELLRAGPVDAGQFERELGANGPALRETVRALEQSGFEIERDDGEYELVDTPAFGADGVATGLAAPFYIEYHDTIGSTNERATALAAGGAENVVVLADEQTGGRGRRDRQWTSPSGGVWLSIVRRPSIEPAHQRLLTLAAGVAVARAARELGVWAEIKWPNDAVVDERKFAGVLTESSGPAGDEWVVVGIGVNANVDPASLPSDRPTTSLLAEAGAPIDRRRFTQRLLEVFDDLLDDVSAVLPAWRALATTLDRRVRVATPSGAVVGTAVDVSDTGALEIETATGRQLVTAGDCEHLRPVE